MCGIVVGGLRVTPARGDSARAVGGAAEGGGAADGSGGGGGDSGVSLLVTDGSDADADAGRDALSLYRQLRRQVGCLLLWVNPYMYIYIYI